MPNREISDLLRAWGRGDLTARDEVLTLVYQDLRQRARARLRHERIGHTLQPTALVNEAYLRLAGQKRVVWKNRAQFFAVAAKMMRRILVDHARGHRMMKRSGRWIRVTLADVPAEQMSDVGLLDLDRALDDLASFDARKSKIAELRLFAGLSLAEAARVLDISVATVERDWRAGRAWLWTRLRPRSGPGSRDDA